MNKKRRAFIAFGVGFMSAWLPLWAHHGTGASYDLQKEVSMKGTVTEFVWHNPHCALLFDVKAENGDVVHWGGELFSPGVMKLAGWTKETLKPGDEITITLNPSKAGTPVGDISKIVFADGKAWLRNGQAGGGQ